MDQPQSLLQRLQSVAWSVFVACLLLWLGVQLLAQIWKWLLAVAVLGAVGWAMWLRWQNRRDRW